MKLKNSLLFLIIAMSHAPFSLSMAHDKEILQDLTPAKKNAVRKQELIQAGMENFAKLHLEITSKKPDFKKLLAYRAHAQEAQRALKADDSNIPFFEEELKKLSLMLDDMMPDIEALQDTYS